MLSNQIQGVPIIAVLRGITPDEVIPVGELLEREGVVAMEVTLNSPQAYRSITELSRRFGTEVLVGAGTVTRDEQVHEVKCAGGRLIVSPHSETGLIAVAKAENMIALPGCFSPTEIFRAVNAGADAVKLFPAEIIPPVAVRALRAVLPSETEMFATGGIDTGNMGEYLRSGINGFAIGSSLYKPGKSLAAIESDVKSIVAAFKQAKQLLAEHEKSKTVT